MKIITLLLVLFFGFAAHAQGVSQVQKDRLSKDMNFIGEIFANYYAPREWKENHVQWDLGKELQKAQDQIQKSNSVKEYRKALVDFLKSTADYHVGFNFYSTETATLPFQVKTVEGKTIFVFIDRNKLPAATFPFQIGDELLSMNGESVALILNGLKAEMGNNVPVTDASMADLSLASRSGRRNNVVPTSVVTLSILRAQSKTPVEVQIAWDYTPEEVKGETLSLKRNPAEEELKISMPIMVSQNALNFMGSQPEANNFTVGARNSFLPDLGTRIWQTESTNIFDAYIYKNEAGKLIGVVRIAKYYEVDHTLASTEFAKIISHFQKVTDGLLINQLNNPGGSVFYLYGLASMLTDTAMTVPKHRMVIEPSDIKSAIGYLNLLKAVKTDEDAVKVFGGNQIHGYPVNFSFAMAYKDYLRFLISEWNQGKRISSPYYLSGVDKINPHPAARYTKPIAILVNELDFSGGDFFPAILQDNKRVTVIGTRTAGAGGYVGSFAFPNSFGLETFSYTGSLAERVNANPIENLGVTPDVPLEMTLEDYRNNFSSYLKEVKAIIKQMVP